MSDRRRGYLYTPSGATTPFAELVGRSGERLRFWHHGALQLPRTYQERHRYLRGWNHVHWAQDLGLLLAVVPLRGLLALNDDSSLRWLAEGAFHHDVRWAPAEGHILVLGERPRRLPAFGEGWLLDNEIMLLTEAGERLGEASIGEALAAHEELAALVRSRVTELDAHGFHLAPALAGDASWRASVACREVPGIDFLHANSLDVRETRRDRFVLVSLRSLNCIVEFLFRHGRLSVTDFWRGGFSNQHSASYLQAGRLLLLDNGEPSGADGGSAALVLDRLTGEALWSWGRTEGQFFFCPVAGHVQSIGEDGFLVADAHAGRAFEVGLDGSVTWEWCCPSDPASGGRGHFYRVEAYELARLVS